MNSAQEIKKFLASHKEELAKQYGVSRLGVFGSWVRGEQKADSDIDLLVEFSRPIGLIKFISLENHLCKLTGHRIDLVMKSALKPIIGQRILTEVKNI